MNKTRVPTKYCNVHNARIYITIHIYYINYIHFIHHIIYIPKYGKSKTRNKKQKFTRRNMLKPEFICTQYC